MSYLARFSTALDVDILASILDGDDIEDVLTGKLVNRRSFSCFQQKKPSDRSANLRLKSLCGKQALAAYPPVKNFASVSR